MKECCKGWKVWDGVRQEYKTKPDTSYPMNYCPTCGSSLKEESKWCECGNPCGGTSRSTGEDFDRCLDCMKFIKPTPKLPEKIDPKKWVELDAKSDWVGQPDFSYIDNLIKKYNQLIDYLKDFTEENKALEEEIDRLTRISEGEKL